MPPVNNSSFNQVILQTSYSFIEPAMIPLTKYFCTKGYMATIGNATSAMVAVW